MQEFIQQIVKETVAGVNELGPIRQRMFLNWMASHASQVRCTKAKDVPQCLAEKLNAWLGTLSVAGILWEYRLILGEIEWWRSLDQAMLVQMTGEKE